MSLEAPRKNSKNHEYISNWEKREDEKEKSQATLHAKQVLIEGINLLKGIDIVVGSSNGLQEETAKDFLQDFTIKDIESAMRGLDALLEVKRKP
jgi:hypothetical protein